MCQKKADLVKYLELGFEAGIRVKNHSVEKDDSSPSGYIQWRVNVQLIAR